MDMISKIKEAEDFAEDLKNKTSEKCKNILNEARKSAELQYESIIKKAEEETIFMKEESERTAIKKGKAFLASMKKYDDNMVLAAQNTKLMAADFIIDRLINFDI